MTFRVVQTQPAQDVLNFLFLHAVIVNMRQSRFRIVPEPQFHRTILRCSLLQSYLRRTVLPAPPARASFFPSRDCELRRRRVLDIPRVEETVALEVSRQ